MKLLSKSDIAKAKAQDKRREIEEGMKIAKSVDSLREIRANEEVSLDEFRRKMVAEINTETASLLEKRDAIAKEVTLLERRLTEALQPLTEEWEKVEKVNAGLEIERQDLDKREKAVVSQETKTREMHLKTREELKRATGERKMTSADLQRAQTKLKQAEDALELSTRHKKETEDEIIKGMKALTEKESQVASSEKNLAAREKALKTLEKTLNDRERFINDKYKTLERTIKRYG